MNNIQLITKEELIGKLKEIETRGWIRNTRNCIEYFHYNKALMLKSVNLERFIDSIEQGKFILISMHERGIIMELNSELNRKIFHCFIKK